jgi:hypothetical protein
MRNPPPIRDAPGAGLPPVEALVTRLAGPWLLAGLGAARGLALFRDETSTLLKLARALDPAALTAPVLIGRRPGLEDSSRNWSPAMVLHHLVLTTRAFHEVVAALAHGAHPELVADTATVKPRPDTGPEVLSEFESVCREFLAMAAHAPHTHRPRHPHPWFGSLSCRQWLALSGIHHRLHRGQLEEIIARRRRLGG